ncbi:hypothetical protein Bca52824_016584 [Brassica carinata]|uniref:TF-B3 domain-containing protein n=1 Tax=Brassica carinata TaxID=52824 RepID=A0A8X7W4Q5_BRACI|nr:hypothetical protein Bca52824_016584 [Brassica carinata]
MILRYRLSYNYLNPYNTSMRYRKKNESSTKGDILGIETDRLHEGKSKPQPMANPHEPHFYNTTWLLLNPHIREDEPENMETKIGRFIYNLGIDTRRQETHQSCCEIQYTHPNIIKEEADADDAPSFSFDYCFLAEVTASNLKEDKLYFSVGYLTCTALNKQCQEIILVNKEGNSWTVSLRFSESDGMFYIRRGWRKFCFDNRCAIGDLFVFNVVGNGKTTPLMCACENRRYK